MPSASHLALTSKDQNEMHLAFVGLCAKDTFVTFETDTKSS